VETPAPAAPADVGEGADGIAAGEEAGYQPALQGGGKASQ